jgi:hypothetical protein
MNRVAFHDTGRLPCLPFDGSHLTAAKRPHRVSHLLARLPVQNRHSERGQVTNRRQLTSRRQFPA